MKIKRMLSILHGFDDNLLLKDYNGNQIYSFKNGENGEIAIQFKTDKMISGIKAKPWTIKMFKDFINDLASESEDILEWQIENKNGSRIHNLGLDFKGNMRFCCIDDLEKGALLELSLYDLQKLEGWDEYDTFLLLGEQGFRLSDFIGTPYEQMATEFSKTHDWEDVKLKQNAELLDFDMEV